MLIFLEKEENQSEMSTNFQVGKHLKADRNTQPLILIAMAVVNFSIPSNFSNFITIFLRFVSFSLGLTNKRYNLD